jgi:hypothetical protein
LSRTYTAYGIGSALSWAALLIVLSNVTSKDTMGYVWAIFVG